MNFNNIPFESITRVGQRNLLYRDLFATSWLLQRFCNYRCSYCWTHGRSNIKDYRPLEVYLGTIVEIKKQARERSLNSFHWSFSGGEPTFNPHYLTILNLLSEDTNNCNYQSVHMTSNISPNFKWLEKYINATKNFNRVSITASFHHEHAKLDEFVDKLVFLQDHSIQVTVNTVMVPEIFDKLIAQCEYILSRNINVTLKPQSTPSAEKVVDGYTSEQRKILQSDMPQQNFMASGKKLIDRPHPKWNPSLDPVKNSTEHSNLQLELVDKDNKIWYLDQAERLNAFDFNKFQNWICSSGWRSIIIREPDGSVKRSYSCRDKPLGWIETGFKLFGEPKACITPTCVSSADSKIPKKHPSSNLKLLEI
jgi:organic radical activating enzyme